MDAENLFAQSIGLVGAQLQSLHADARNREDLWQEGMIGLWEAACRFDATKGCEFSTWAVPRIRGRMLHYLRDSVGTIRIPGAQHEAGVRSQCFLECDLANGLPEESVPFTLDLRSVVAREIETLPTPNVSRIQQDRTRKVLYSILVEERTPTEAAERTGCSRYHVRRAVQRALPRLRRALERIVAI
jgi:RNA polymerase sigma-B factor